MSVGTILVSLNDVERGKELLAATSALAERNDSHVIGHYVVPAVYVHPGISGHAAIEAIDYGRKYFQDHAAGVKELFQEEMRKQGFKGEWRQEDGMSHLVASSVIEHGRQADLIIASQGGMHSNNGCEPDFAERVVMEAGRPVLLVPNAGTFNSVAQNVVFGWNATRESARAAFDALPLLAKGAKAHVMWVDADRNAANGVLPGAELATTLSRHGIDAISEPFASSNIDVADALLNRVSDAGADMLVMGAYGHSRLRELVFGGATRKVLDTMTVPVLMSH